MFLALALLLDPVAANKACAADDTLPVLRYFDVRGRGEVIRLAFHDVGVPFEDAAFSFDAWGKERPDGLKAKWTAEGRRAVAGLDHWTS